MKNFNKLDYERIDIENSKNIINSLISDLEASLSYKDYLNIVKKIIKYQNHIEEMYDYADIRNMRNMNDEYWNNEINYWNSIKPQIDLLFIPFYKELLCSKYKEQLLKIIPENFFRIIDSVLKTSSEKNVELLKVESELKVKYRNLNKSKILFDNDERTISSISGLFSNKDRDIRKKAHDSINDFYLKHANEYQSILYELVTVRNKIATNLGFENYGEYSLFKLKRFGYNYKDINKFRENIVKYIVPLCKKISILQKAELNLESLMYYDTVFFLEMPELTKNGIELLDSLKDSFKVTDIDLFDLYSSMLKNNYIDFVQRDGKVNFSITNYLSESGLPVVTGNYKNNYLDLQTTTHEMGHAFQKYCASLEDKKHVISSLLKYPTMEIAEMFSYAMELIMMQKVDNLFSKEDYNKYSFMKIYNLVSQLPYICAVDEFQEMIYSKEDLKIEDLNSIWLKLVQKYNLEKNNTGHVNLEKGGYYYRQSHIFLDPFYYIDYALSYFGALSIWNNCQENLNLFKEIAAVASYYSFKDLIEVYHMPSPFDEESVKDVADVLEDKLNILIKKAK